jgi:CO dehydrogenase/acetyl-CoA synthase delta subunit
MTTDGSPVSDSMALDAVCAILNTTESGADVVQAVTEIVAATDRPVVDGLAVVEARVEYDRHALPTAVIDVNGVETVRLWITRDGAVRTRITRPSDAALGFCVEDRGSGPDS